MLPRNVQYYFVTFLNSTTMYGYDTKGNLGHIFNLPWLKPYLFCSQIEAQKIAKKHRGVIRFWKGKTYENSPDNNDLRL